MEPHQSPQPADPHDHCPICGAPDLRAEHGEFRFDPPASIPGGTIVIPHARWHTCSACGEQIIPHDITEALEHERNRRLGLLTPEEIRAVRARTGLSAVDMASLLGVGEKTYTRWESGRSLHNKSSDMLIRLADRYAEMFAAVEAERQPGRHAVVQDYIARITTLKAGDDGAVAAHGADLSTLDAQSIRVRLVELNARGAVQGTARGAANGAAQGGPRGTAWDPGP